ncbi:MAG: SDR family oxidoreductase [Proteobacteria bacterium]|nr:SDR family oxidoreductase [Pseudomonadota bacterium]
MKNKVVLITGCSTGIGRALSLRFQKSNFTVYATSRNSNDIKDLEDCGIKTDQLDVNDGDDIDRVVNTILSQEEGIDVLINNAGFAVMGPMAEISTDDIRMQLETNVISIASICKAIIPGMIERKEGTIVNIGSISGLLTTPFSGIYCASKAAVHAMSDAMRMELAPFNIRVLTVQPGAIKSSFGSTASKSVAGYGNNSDSYYSPITEAIQQRAVSSQENPTSVEEFSEKLIAEILFGTKEIVRIGRMSKYLPFIAKWLPRGLIDKMLSAKFSLSKL